MIADVQVASLDYFKSCLMLLFGALPVLRAKKMVKLRETNRRTHFSQEKAILKIEIFEYYRILTSLQKVLPKLCGGSYKEGRKASRKQCHNRNSLSLKDPA